MIQPRTTPLIESAHTALLLKGGGAAHARAVADLLSQGVPVPLPHRAVWASTKPQGSFWFLSLQNVAGTTVAGFTMEVYRARTFPGQLLLRSKRWGASVPTAHLPAITRACAALLRRDSRVLELDIELFEPDEQRRALMAKALEASGFRSAAQTRTYSATLMCALPATDAEHFASLSAKTRRDIRMSEKHPVEIRTIECHEYVSRMNALTTETFNRTGGHHPGEDWLARIALSAESPHLSRVIGLFRANDPTPDGLLAFAWGCCHGEVAHYEASGSCRPADLRIPLSYCLIWDLMCWARANGARWFDMGGISHEQGEGHNPVAGIAKFKRNFADKTVQVGMRWVFDPSPTRAAIGRKLRAAASVLRTPPRVGRARAEYMLQSVMMAPISLAFWHRFAHHLTTAAVTISALLRRR